MRALFEGHWRALEQAFLTALASERKRPLAVVTAGYPLLERIAGLLSDSGQGDLAGVHFFPGIPGLAQKLSPLPVSPPPSPADVTACALASYGPERAAGGGSFLAGLLEQGIGAEEFGQVIMSLPDEPGFTALETLHALKSFEESMDGVSPGRADAIMRDPPGNGFAGVLMYGFYDLNPGQRRFVRALAENTPITWFSPIHPSSPWRSVYSKTGVFLGAMFGNQRHRVDSRIPLSPMALLGESLLTGKALSPPPGLKILQCGSGLGFDHAVTLATGTLLGLRPGFRVAVVARGADRNSVALALNLAGFSTNPGVSIPWSSTPFGGFLLGVCGLPRWNWHHLQIHRLLASGVVFGQSPEQYLQAVVQSGARFGRNALESLEMPFAKKLVAFADSLPQKGSPGIFIGALKKLLEDPSGLPIPLALTGEVLHPLRFRFQSEVTLEGFRAMLEAQLEGTRTEVFPKDPVGIPVLSPEQIRGALFDGVVVTGLEETVLPSRHMEDPRFPAVLRTALEMATGDTREKEEAFTLRQVFEAAGERLTLVVRSRNSEGRSQEPSPFISRLTGPDEYRHFSVQAPDSAAVLIPPPVSAPFLSTSLAAEEERLFRNSFGPHDGIVGPGVVPVPRTISASMLEAYAACPFKYLVERVWKLPDDSAAPVLSFPDPAAHGSFTHRAVELALAGSPPPIAAESALAGENLTARLGSQAFAENYRKTLTVLVERAMDFFRRREYRLVASERTVSGVFGGFPATGRLDILATGPEGLVALDLKTGNPGKTRKPLENMNLFQLPVYYTLCSEKPAGMGYLHLWRDNDPVLNHVTADEIVPALPRYLKKTEGIMAGIAAGRFPPSPDSDACGFCSWAHLCRKSPEIRMKRKVSGEDSTS